MERYQIQRLVLYRWWQAIVEIPRMMKCRIWNKNILLWWHRLWIRRNDMHRSLDMDAEAMIEMSEHETNKYLAELMRRRSIA
jgi:hypothetical protein